MVKSTASSKPSKGRDRSNGAASTSGRSDSGLSRGSDVVAATESPVRRLRIKPLATVGDKGKPSGSLSKDLRRVVNFIEDERHLVAYELYQNARGRWDAMLREKREDDAAKEGSVVPVPVKAPERPRRSWIRAKSNTGRAIVFDEAEFEAASGIVKKHKKDFSLLMVRF
jgi:hypothetical protein